MTDTNDEPTMRTQELNYPRTLRLTLSDAESMFDQALATAAAFESGEEVHPEATRAFQDIADLRELLTDRRLEVLRSIHETPPDSISALAERLDRSYSLVHKDVEILADHDIVYFLEGERGAKQPYIPYENIRVDIPLVGSSVTASSLEGGQDRKQTHKEQREERELWLRNAVDPRIENYS
jgi:predicted transcriptional regulator